MNTGVLKNGWVLGGSTAIAMLVIFTAFNLTRETIETTRQLALQATLVELLEPGTYDNDPAVDIILLTDPALGSDAPQPIYRARASGVPVGVVISCTAPDGYNGDIDLLVGLNYEGKIVAVRVVDHNETPGLGDDIDVNRSDWIHSFDNLSSRSMAPQAWQVKKDGGRFDQFTGATITPRAVVHSVRDVVRWYLQSRDRLYVTATDDAQ